LRRGEDFRKGGTGLFGRLPLPQLPTFKRLRPQFVVFPSDTVDITGKTSVYNYKADSGNTASSHFCPICGSQLYGHTTGFPGMVGVRVACLEDSSDLKPQMEVYTKRLQAWDTVTEGIPSFPAMPPMNAAAE
jgi:hypothetical protein